MKKRPARSDTDGDLTSANNVGQSSTNVNEMIGKRVYRRNESDTVTLQTASFDSFKRSFNSFKNSIGSTRRSVETKEGSHQVTEQSSGYPDESPQLMSKFDSSEMILPSLEHSNSQILPTSLSLEYSEIANRSPTKSKHRRTIILDFDGTLFPYVNVLSKLLNLKVGACINPVYQVVLLMNFVRRKKVEQHKSLIISRDRLYRHGCDPSAMKYLHDQGFLTGITASSVTINIAMVNKARNNFNHIMQTQCKEVFILLQKCNELGRLVIVSNGGRYWIEQSMELLLSCLRDRVLLPPRWHPSHHGLSDADMYEICDRGIECYYPFNNSFPYPKATCYNWKLPVIYMKRKVDVFTDIVCSWKSRDLISIGDGCLEFNACAAMKVTKLAVRRVHFGYVDASAPPDLVAAHRSLMRELPSIVERLEGRNHDIVITVPVLEKCTDYCSPVKLEDRIPDVQMYDPLPSMPLFIRSKKSVDLVTHTEDLAIGGIILRSHSIAADS